MSNITKEQEDKIIDLIFNGDDLYSFGDGDKYWEPSDELEEYLKDNFGEVTYECVAEWGGEGQGDDIGSVWFFKEIDLYIRIDGYYSSHNGTDWDEHPYAVRPKEKTVIFYE